MSRHCSSVKSVWYDLSFIAPLPRILTTTRRVNNSPDQMSHDNNGLKFGKSSNGQVLSSAPKPSAISLMPSIMRFQEPPKAESLNHISIPHVNNLPAELIDGKMPASKVSRTCKNHNDFNG